MQGLFFDYSDRLLGVSPDGAPCLALCGEAGKGRAALMVLPDGSPSLALFDETGKGRLELGVGDGSPSLTLLDKDETTRAVLGATSTKTLATGVVHQRPESSLVLLDKDSKVVWSVP